MNRYMKYVDLGVQMLCILMALIALAKGLIAKDVDPRHWPLLVLFAQAILGPWQMLSSGISIFTWAPLRRLKIIHFVSALVYLASLAILFAFDSVDNASWSQWLITIPAWILALYYHFLSWCWVIRANSRHGGFLPHLGF
jgi:hypothetical protein